MPNRKSKTHKLVIKDEITEPIMKVNANPYPKFMINYFL
jgi:hypothetical protein